MRGLSQNLWTYTHRPVGKCLSYMMKVVATSEEMSMTPTKETQGSLEEVVQTPLMMILPRTQAIMASQGTMSMELLVTGPGEDIVEEEGHLTLPHLLQVHPEAGAMLLVNLTGRKTNLQLHMAITSLQ